MIDGQQLPVAATSAAASLPAEHSARRQPASGSRMLLRARQQALGEKRSAGGTWLLRNVACSLMRRRT